MRKSLSLILAVFMAMTFACTALAEPAGETSARRSGYDGQVAATESVTLTAPFGGRVLDFSLHVGDAVAAGEAVLSLSTTKVYAPEDGTVMGLRARPGDDAADIQARYGALCYIETNGRYRIETSTSESYDEKETKYVYVGEKVYLRSTANNDRVGTGTIISVDGSNFVVEVNESNLRVNENTGIFRADDYDSESRIGRGKTKRANPIAVNGTGSVGKCYVREGDAVRRGDLLFELVDGTLDGLSGVDAGVTCDAAGAVAEIFVKAGDTVVKGQPLIAVHPEGKLCVEVTLGEGDLKDIKVGETVRIEFDASDVEQAAGTVRAVSLIGRATEDDAEYTVYIDFADVASAVREGMSVTVYPN